MRHAMIMAGGSGTRLWPVSRDGQPKQLIEFIPSGSGRPKSLLEIAAGRLEGLVPEDRRIICTGERYREQIRRVLPEFGDEQILGEPSPRDTVNAVGFTAAVLAEHDPEAVFAVLTADHLIEPQDVFQKRLKLGFELVEQDPTRLVTFAIKPTYPATGFGYVERGTPITSLPGCIEDGQQLAFKVAKFVEKPPLHKAQVYVQSGVFGWNSGMFVFKASTVLECLERFAPASFAGLMQIKTAWDTPERERVLNEVYPTLPKKSVDYAIMEPASMDSRVSVCTVDMDVRWLDVGSWPSFFETLSPGEHGHRATGLGQSIFEGGKGCCVYNAAESHTVALVGCEDLVVVHTPKATLVMPAEKAQDLKKLWEHLPPEIR
ncbi:MAG TPA: mannose-1-phosphate guanylyltransferase [Phycisphaerales bacterium]|nr:mannose-1-phosphate guanylyltransferase [Phycisphaerales bacterium]